LAGRLPWRGRAAGAGEWRGGRDAEAVIDLHTIYVAVLVNECEGDTASVQVLASMRIPLLASKYVGVG